MSEQSKVGVRYRVCGCTTDEDRRPAHIDFDSRRLHPRPNAVLALVAELRLLADVAKAAA